VGVEKLRETASSEVWRLIMLACRSGCGKTSPSKFTKNGSFNAGTDGGLCRCRDGRESKVFPTRFHLTPLRSNRYGETYRGSVVVFFGQWKDENSFKHRWDGTYEREGVHDLHFHDLRHTFASWLMQGGGDYMVIEKLLGHRYREQGICIYTTGTDASGMPYSSPSLLLQLVHFCFFCR